MNEFDDQPMAVDQQIRTTKAIVYVYNTVLRKHKLMLHQTLTVQSLMQRRQTLINYLDRYAFLWAQTPHTAFRYAKFTKSKFIEGENIIIELQLGP